MRTLALIGHIGVFGWRILEATFYGRVPFRAFYQCLATVIIRCILPVMAIVFPFGMVMSIQGLNIFALYGSQRMLSAFVMAAIVRELSPVMASVLVAAQGGSSFAAELGAMRIKEEIEATEVMAVDAIGWHVAPRFWALAVACPILNVMGCFSGVVGGYISAVWIKGEPSGTFLAGMWDLVRWYDPWATVLKTTVFGVVIGVLACYLGYHTKGGAAGVGQAVNQTVVWSVLTFITINYLLTSAIFGGVS